ncbi:MAG: hypothetical protein J7K87_02975 [Candidatus Aenigmarchaeota archaeon]|nr:hypothetical protein [Candidatus Aenigmarchaeota archaeon]
MKKFFGAAIFLVSFLFILSFFSSSALAEVNMTIDIDTTGDVDSVSNINTDGNVRVWINGVEWSGELESIENYIVQNQGTWSKDTGLETSDIADILDRLARYRKGEDVGITQDEYNILISLLGLSDDEISDFYNNKLGPILNTHRDRIQSNIYEIEALYRTMEKLHPDVYCESRKEVMKEYGLRSVVCGLHSKVCYNGNFNLAERGFDFCVYSDAMGFSERGMNIHVESIKIPDSEENSLTPVAIEFFNEGDETLKPKVKIDVKQLDVLKYSFETELEEIPIRDGKLVYTLEPRLISFDNSKLKPGKYTAKVIISLGKKEIYDDVDFNILKKGTLKMNGEMTSIESGKPLNHKNLQINVFVKNNMNIPRAFKVRGEVYRNGEKIGDLVTEERVIGSGDTQPLPVTYNIDGLGDYKINFVLNGQKESFTFSPEPTTPTGRFISSPTGGLIGLAVLFGLFGSRFYFGKKRIKKKSKK